MVGADDSALMAVPAYQWIRQGNYEDVLFDLSANEGIARISINRPEKRNAFRPRTVSELYDAFARVRDNPRIGVVLFTELVLLLMVPMPFAPAVTNRCAAMAATSMRRAPRG